MQKIRVLIVDDAVVVRRVVGDVLATDPHIDVVGTAANGRIALQKLTQVNPDVVTLDVEMPEMDGLQTLREIRKTHPHLPVIMFSTLTARGCEATLDALSAGASDYVTKPANVGSVTLAQQRIRDELIPKIISLCRREQQPALYPPAPPAVVSVPPRATVAPVTSVATSQPRVTLAHPNPSGFDVIAIGVSTGGPNALAALIPQLPKTLPVPIVIVQHMPPMFTRFLADRLAAQSQVKVCEAQGGEVLEPGHVYIAPGNFHMVIERRGTQVVTALNQDPQENSCRPAVDVLFRSVASVYGGHTLGVILTGMGQDGLRGCERLAELGASIIAQDEASSVVWGMPGFVAKAGLATAVLPLAEIAQDLTRRVTAGARMTVAAR